MTHVAFKDCTKRASTNLASNEIEIVIKNCSKEKSRRRCIYCLIPPDFLKIIHLFTCAYIVWVISPLCPLPNPLPPSSPQFQTGPILPLSLILLKKRHTHNKEDKAFLVVELRRAIQKDS
jgi:hypothetical protein